MKKKLEAELVSIAHRVLKLKGKEDVDKLHAEVARLYEKLTVLKFAHENFEDDMPTIASDTSFFKTMNEAFNNKLTDSVEVEDRMYVNVDDVKRDSIMEPAIEKIKDIVAQMPEEAQQVDALLKKAKAGDKKEVDFNELMAGFEKMPEFEPVSKSVEPKKKSLNDKLKNTGFKIGLNDKLAFIKHLFDGKVQDYERVLSQLNTTTSFSEASKLINQVVKPDYNWENKEEYETRFLEIVESRFAH